MNTNGSSFWQNVSLRQVALGTALVALTLLGFALLIGLRYIIILLFLGIVVATALAPVAERLRHYGLSRLTAVATAYILLIVIVVGVTSALVPFFLAQAERVLFDLPELYANLRTTLAGSPSNLLRNLSAQLPPDPFAGITGVEGLELGATVALTLPTTARGITFTVLVLLLSYYWLYYRDLALQSMALLLPINWRTEAIDLWNQVEERVGAFVRGLVILSLTIAVLSAIGYSLIGLPYGITIAIIAGLLEVIPYVGPFLAMLLSGIVGLSVSPEMAIKAVAVAALVQFVESTIIVPRVMDRAVGVRPVVTLLALAVFAELFGLIGALLAVPLAAAIQVLLDRFVLSAPAPEHLDIGGRDEVAMLRYHTQDLAGDLRQQVRSKEEEVTSEIDAIEEELEALLLDLDSLLAASQEQRP